MPTRFVTVTTTLTPLAPYNARRRVLGIFNLGTTDNILFSQDQVNINTQGYPVLVNTGIALVRFDGDEPELGYYAVAASGSQNVRIFEGFGDPNDATGSEA